jgi:hypothetical protein
MDQTELEMAQRRIAQGRRLVAEQRENVARLQARGADTYEAHKELDLFEDSLATFEEHLAALQSQ